MFNKRRDLISILLISCLLVFTGCDVSKKVKTDETKDFSQSVLESNEKIKDLKFYFRRPALRAELIYDGDLSEEDFKYLINNFKDLIDIDFMQRIGDKYWGGEMAWRFHLNIYINEESDGKTDYQLSTDYRKTHNGDDGPGNTDGFETWYIEDRDHRITTVEP